MFKKFFKKSNKENMKDKNILITALLIPAAKIDENYTSVEKEIIKKALINLDLSDNKNVQEILMKAE